MMKMCVSPAHLPLRLPNLVGRGRTLTYFVSFHEPEEKYNQEIYFPFLIIIPNLSSLSGA